MIGLSDTPTINSAPPRVIVGALPAYFHPVCVDGQLFYFSFIGKKKELKNVYIVKMILLIKTDVLRYPRVTTFSIYGSENGICISILPAELQVTAGGHGCWRDPG